MFISAIALTFTSCSKSSSDPAEPCSPGSYEFLVDESSTVFYDGQTARLQMAGQIMDAMNSNTSTVEMITDMFDNGTGFDGNLMGTSTPLDETGKKVGSKTAATETADATVKSSHPCFYKLVIIK